MSPWLQHPAPRRWYGPHGIADIAKPASRQALIDCAVDHRGRLYVTATEGMFQQTTEGWRLFAAERGDNTDDAMPIITRPDGKLLTYVSSQSLRLPTKVGHSPRVA